MPKVSRGKEERNGRFYLIIKAVSPKAEKKQFSCLFPHTKKKILIILMTSKIRNLYCKKTSSSIASHIWLWSFSASFWSLQNICKASREGKEEKETAGPSSLDYWKSLEFLTSLSNRPTRKTTDLTKHVCNLTHMQCVKYTLTQSILSRRVTSEKLLFSFFFWCVFFWIQVSFNRLTADVLFSGVPYS